MKSLKAKILSAPQIVKSGDSVSLYVVAQSLQDIQRPAQFGLKPVPVITKNGVYPMELPWGIKRLPTIGEIVEMNYSDLTDRPCVSKLL